MRIKIDPDTDASGFGYAEAGLHRLRVAKVELINQSAPKYPYLKWQFEFADPNTPSAEKDSGGGNKKLGNVFENTTLKSGNNSQFRLRQLCDACGVAWGAELDMDSMIGLEFEANLSIEEYNGIFSNKVARFIPAA